MQNLDIVLTRITIISLPYWHFSISSFQVWLLSAGFYDAYNLSVKLDTMYDMLNSNADHITANAMIGYVTVSSAKVCIVDHSIEFSLVV